MDNEQILINLYKQQQYDESRNKLQKMILATSVAASALGILLTLVFQTTEWSIYVFVGPIVSVAIVGLLLWLKVLRLNTACFIAMLYNCCVFTPSLWLITGISGAAPLVSLIILVAIMTMFSGLMLKWLLSTFLLILLGLTVYSALHEFSTAENITSLVYIIAGYLTTVVVIALYMLSRNREFNKLNDRFLRSSFKDELTQLLNRRLLDLIIEYQESLYKRQRGNYIFVMFDVDDFKKMNDEHGHIYGDIVLRTIAHCIQEKARSSDFVVRYGGDEFLVIQTNASDVSIKNYIARIEEAMESSCDLGIPVSASYGYALRSECESPEAVLKLADERLYERKQAKKAGL